MDPIADMLTRIRNGQATLKQEVSIPYSNLKYNIAKILKQEGFVKDVKKAGKKNQKEIKIEIKYKDDAPAIRGSKKISKPGQRIYKSAREIRPVKGGYGTNIISTSQGLMTGEEAKKKNIGGELICEIW